MNLLKTDERLMHKGKLKQLILMAVTISLISGCGTAKQLLPMEIIAKDGTRYEIPGRYRDVPGIEILGQYCADEGGQRIDKVVYVDGYYDDQKHGGNKSAWQGLIRGQFQYIELTNRNTETYYPINEPGTWKLYKSDKGDPNCHPGINADLDTYMAEPYFSFSMNACIAVVKQEQIESQYGYFLSLSEIQLNNKYRSSIYKNFSYIENLQNGKKIAAETDFTLAPRHILGNKGWGVSCKNLNIHPNNQTIFLSVLKSKEGE